MKPGEAPDGGLKELQHQVNELQASNQELCEFTGAVVHDLRNPLTEVLCSAGLLASLAQVANHPPALDLVSRILRGAEKMRSLTDAHLAFSRTAAQPLNPDRVALEALVNMVRQELAPRIKNRTITWRIGPMPEVRGDASLLRQALVNLIANAIKFTGGRAVAEIEVGAHPSAEEWVIFVRDNGIGFSMADAGKLFQKPQRLHKQDIFPGSGVGLMIVQKIVRRHGGKIWVESAPDKGATFYFTLPASRS